MQNRSRKRLDAEKSAEWKLLKVLLLLRRESLAGETLRNLLSRSRTWSRVLPQHSRVLVQAAVHWCLPVALVCQDIIPVIWSGYFYAIYSSAYLSRNWLEARRALLLVGNAIGALVVDVAPLLVGEVSLWCGTVEVGAALPGATHKVLLDAHAQIPVGAGDVHQPGEGVVARHVLHLGQVGELLARLSVSGRLVDRAEQRLCLASWVQVRLRLQMNSSLGLELARLGWTGQVGTGSLAVVASLRLSYTW